MYTILALVSLFGYVPSPQFYVSWLTLLQLDWLNNQATTLHPSLLVHPRYSPRLQHRVRYLLDVHHVPQGLSGSNGQVHKRIDRTECEGRMFEGSSRMEGHRGRDIRHHLVD